MAINKKTSKTSSKRQPQKPYVRYSTIWKGVGGGLTNPNESKVCKVGSYRVRLTRAARLNKYGNPVHTATVIKPGGSTGGTYTGAGSATTIASKALYKSGVETKFTRKKKKRNG